MLVQLFEALGDGLVVLRTFLVVETVANFLGAIFLDGFLTKRTNQAHGLPPVLSILLSALAVNFPRDVALSVQDASNNVPAAHLALGVLVFALIRLAPRASQKQPLFKADYSRIRFKIAHDKVRFGVLLNRSYTVMVFLLLLNMLRRAGVAPA